jgi:membrane protease YdiL (CAAX protease family)
VVPCLGLLVATPLAVVVSSAGGQVIFEASGGSETSRTAAAFGLFWLLIRGVARSGSTLLPTGSTVGAVLLSTGMLAIAHVGISAEGSGLPHTESWETTALPNVGRNGIHAAMTATAALLTSVGGSLIEELVFRFWLPFELSRALRMSCEAGGCRVALGAMLLSQLAFALAHLPSRGFSTAALPRPRAFVALFLKGIVLLVLARATRGLAVPAIAHWMHNWFFSTAAPLERSNAASVLSAGCLSAVAGMLVLIHSHQRKKPEA